ncbi:MAG: VCBS repeat-containing protein [Bacteroidia bacterium]|nr:VCBS repeat-containing protein [Bacteroidia bacterium]
MKHYKQLFQRFVPSALLFVFIFMVTTTAKAQVTNRSGVDSTIFISHTVFLPKFAYTSGKENWDLAVGDFNKDGSPDIVSISQLDSKVNIHINDGHGGFGSIISYPTGNFPRSVCVLDANGDGWLDVATASIKDMSVNVHLNDGKGGLLAKRSLRTSGGFPHDIQAADIDQDGKMDLIVVSNTASTVNIHKGDGNGMFAGADAIRTGGMPRCVKVYDINEDGLPDLLVGADDRTINLHINLGGGKFAPKEYLLTAESIWGIGVADFNGDGKPDVCGTSYSVNSLCIHYNEGVDFRTKKIKWAMAKCIDSGDKNFDLVVEDFDMDGDPDIVTASTRDEVINVHLNKGGVIQDKATITSGNWNAGIVAADFDGDKDIDIATASIKDNNINIHRNRSIDPEPEATSTCVYGTVFDKDTGKPLPAIISILKPDGYSFKSVKSEDGKYKMCGVPFYKGYTLAVKSKGFPKYEESFDLPKEVGEDGLKIDVYLQRIKETFVYGKIIDMETKLPLAGASVTIKNKDGNLIATVKADATGNYKYSLPFDSNYELTAEFPDYNSKTGSVSLFPSDYPKGVEKNFELMKIKPKTTACVQGYVMDDKTKDKLSDAELKILDKEGNIIKKVKSDASGHYEACDIPFGDYDVSTTRKDYMFKVDSFSLAPRHAETPLDKDIELTRFFIGMNIVLNDIFYDVAKATLRPESKDELDRLIKIMVDNPTLVIEISGHTDSDGSDAYNLNLSQRRAQSVVDYLIEANIADNRLVAKGYGETTPRAPNDTPANKQLNRRTELKVLDF